MNFPSRETVDRLRREYPVGCRIVLDEMDDPYTTLFRSGRQNHWHGSHSGLEAGLSDPCDH